MHLTFDVRHSSGQGTQRQKRERERDNGEKGRSEWREREGRGKGVSGGRGERVGEGIIKREADYLTVIEDDWSPV